MIDIALKWLKIFRKQKTYFCWVTEVEETVLQKAKSESIGKFFLKENQLAVYCTPMLYLPTICKHLAARWRSPDIQHIPACKPSSQKWSFSSTRCRTFDLSFIGFLPAFLACLALVGATRDGMGHATEHNFYLASVAIYPLESQMRFGFGVEGGDLERFSKCLECILHLTVVFVCKCNLARHGDQTNPKRQPLNQIKKQQPQKAQDSKTVPFATAWGSRGDRLVRAPALGSLTQHHWELGAATLPSRALYGGDGWGGVVGETIELAASFLFFSKILI